MTTPDDPSTLYQIGGAVAIMVGGGFAGFRWVMGQARALASLSAVETKKTTIVTADTVAMDRLTGALDNSNVILSENNVLRKEELEDRKQLRAALEANRRATELAAKASENAAEETAELRRDIHNLAIQLARVGK